MDKLKREHSELDVWSLALGVMIAWVCYVLPGNRFLNGTGPLRTAIALYISAAMGYSYTSATTFVLHLCDKQNDEFKMKAHFTFLGSLLLIGFTVFLLMPGSPAVLSTPSLITLIVWGLMGLGFYLSSKDYHNATDAKRALSFGLEDVHGDA